ICRDTCAGAGTGAAGIAVKNVGIFREASAAAPSAGRMTRANVGPFAEVGFAENHGAGLAESLDDERIFRRLGSADQGQRAGGGHHLVGGVDVVFDDDGDAVERTAGALVFAFTVKRVGDLEGVGIQFDDAVDGRPLPV